MSIDRNARVYVAGHKGLAGSAIWRKLTRSGFTNLIGRSHAELDLLNGTAVQSFLQAERPDYVFIAAAKVGGILANDTEPAEFLYQNLEIQNHLIDGAFRLGVKKLLFLGSSCVYPKLAPQPMGEKLLLSGPLEPTNQWYSVAKISGIKLCQAYRRQYGCDFISALPTHIYGPNYNYDLPRPCLFLMQHYSEEQFINVGFGRDVSIRDLADLVRHTVGFAGEVVWD